MNNESEHQPTNIKQVLENVKRNFPPLTMMQKSCRCSVQQNNVVTNSPSIRLHTP